MADKERQASGMSGPIAFVWLTEATYPRFLEVIADRQRFADDFEGWRERAQRQVDTLRARGVSVEKVLIDPDELLAWCRANGRAVDTDARAHFAALKLMEKNRRGPAH